MPDLSVPVLFGAFDRHNFGDLLFPHVVAALSPQRAFRACGLAARDLSAYGGHAVAPLAAPAAHLVHAGGELLTCTAWQAAVMLREADEAAAVLRRFDADPAAGAAWAARELGVARTLPYVAGRTQVAPGGQLIFNAVGGVEWDAMPSAARAEAAAALRDADWLSVRDRVTQAALQADGIDASLCPDPGVMVAQCFGDVVRAHSDGGAVKALRDACPRGYLACQFSADFADDASLDALARGLDEAMSTTGFDVVLFRAGAAPWHDDLALYDKLLPRLPAGRVHVFRGLHLWDLCALIAASRGTITSSLHGRIVALACGLPRVSLALPQQRRPGKVEAFARTWEPADLPSPVAPHNVGTALAQACAVPADVLRDTASQLCARYRASQTVWAGLLPAPKLAQ